MDDPTSLSLVGYVPLTDPGFALPIYGAGRRPNQAFVAVTAVEGDHAAVIAGFIELHVENLVDFDEPRLDVDVGSPWLDVFLMGGCLSSARRPRS